MKLGKLLGAALPVAGRPALAADASMRGAAAAAVLLAGAAGAAAAPTTDAAYEEKLNAKVREVLGIGGIEDVTLNRGARRMFQRLLTLEGVPPPKGSALDKPTGRPDDDIAMITVQMDARSGGGTITVALDARQRKGARDKDGGRTAERGDAMLARHLAEQQEKFRAATEGRMGRRLAQEIRHAVGGVETNQSGAVGLLGVDRDGKADFRIMIGTASRRDVLDRSGSGMLERLSGAQLLAIDSWIDGVIA